MTLTKPRIILLALLALALLLAVSGELAGAATISPAPAPDGIVFRARLFNVDCALGFCSAGVTVTINGVPRTGYLLGRGLYEGQYVTVTAEVRGWRLAGVRRLPY